MLIPLVALALSGCHFVEHVAEHVADGGQDGRPTLIGSGVPKSENRVAQGFDRIEASGAVSLKVTSGAASVKVTADDNLLQAFETKVEGKVLRIRFNQSVSTKIKTQVEVTVPSLASLHLSGASTCVASGITKDEFLVELTGASKLLVSGDTKRLTARVSGSSGLIFEGSADTCEIEAEGASTVTGPRVLTLADVTASGASTIGLGCKGEMRAKASGASKIVAMGGVKKLTKDVSGASSVDLVD